MKKKINVSSPLSLVYSFDDPEEQVEILNELILSVLDLHAPIKRIRFTCPPAPWMNTPEINEIVKMRKEHRIRAYSTGTDADWKTYRDLRNRLKKCI